MGDPAPGTAFLQAMDWLMRSEGTRYVDNPADHGGPTRYGITLRAWRDYVGHAVDPQAIANLTETDASRFYFGCYWQPCGAAQLHDTDSAIALFDTAVLYGVPRTVRMAQQAMGLAPDGRFGELTRCAIDAAGTPCFIKALLGSVTQRIAEIVNTDPTQRVFLAGWLARAVRLLDLCIDPPAPEQSAPQA